jgi:MarR family transcriptional regulator, organic hydroperoxide resistance regulator
MPLLGTLNCAQLNCSIYNSHMSLRNPSQTPTAARRRASSKASGWLSLDQQLCFALYSASLAMTKLYKPLLEPLGLTYPQYLVMLVLWQADGMAVSQIGERLALDSGTLTPLLKRLQAAGLVQRLRDAADERRVLLQLTAAGRALKAQARHVPQVMAEATGCELGELAALTTRLKALRDRLIDSPPRAA